MSPLSSYRYMPVLNISDAHFFFPPLSFQLQVHCSLSVSPTRISPFHRYLSDYRCVSRSLPLRRASALSTARCPATGTLSFLYLSDTRLPFPASGALPALYLSDARLSFPPPSVTLQVCCTLSSTTRISPFHYPATGALPAFYHRRASALSTAIL